jgi:hypothetical protein
VIWLIFEGFLSERKQRPLAARAHRLDKYIIGSERIVGLVRTAQFRQLDADIRRANGSIRGRSAVYTTNIATPAANIATVVIVTTDHPWRELGWSCIIFIIRSDDQDGERKGANSPLMTAVQ